MTLAVDPQFFALLAYPSFEPEVLHARTRELQALGVKSLIEFGPERVSGSEILGKGYCGLVLLAGWCASDQSLQQVALKVRRTDSSKETFDQEAQCLAAANAINIGPRLRAHSQNFLVMDYLPGPTLYDWLGLEPPRALVYLAIQRLLWQCYRLDQIGLDHGNLRCVTAHVLMQHHHPVLIDFSSGSRDRRAANVTTVIQGLLWSTVLSVRLRQYLQIPQKETLVPLLRQYKHAPDRDRFQQILGTLGFPHDNPA